MFNSFKTAILLSALTALILIVGQLLGGHQGLIIAFAFALIMNGGSYWFSDKIVLSLYRARELKYEDAPDLHRIVESLSNQAGIPKPRVYLIPSQNPNAFATGRNPDHAVVAVTEGILRLLNTEELEGVLAHELSHVKNRDILVSTIAAVFATAISYLAWMFIFMDPGRRGWLGIVGSILVMILAPMAAMLIQMAISRTREYGADAGGAKYSNPLYLASALEKISGNYQVNPQREGNKSMSHMYIANPFGGDNIKSLFSTHPPMKERVKRLRGGVM